MQRVKIDAATIGIVNGAGQQVVKINSHRQDHNQPRPTPSIFKEENGYQSRRQKVQGKV
jgi:hypothetical protein